VAAHAATSWIKIFECNPKGFVCVTQLGIAVASFTVAV